MRWTILFCDRALEEPMVTILGNSVHSAADVLLDVAMIADEEKL